MFRNELLNCSKIEEVDDEEYNQNRGKNFN